MVVLVAVLLLISNVFASDLETVRSRGKLIMLCVPHQENVFVHTKVEAGAMPRVGSTKQFAGVDVELMEGFAETLGVSLEIRPALGSDGIPSYSALIPALLQEEGDIVASSFSITPARSEKVEFSVPYYIVRTVVVARKETHIKFLEDLKGKISGTIKDSSHEEHLLRLGFEADSIKYAGFMLENYLILAEKTVDFIIVDSTSAFRLVPNIEGLEVKFELEGDDKYGVAVRPSSDLKALLDSYLDKARKSGRVMKLLRKAEPGIGADSQ